MSANEYRQMAAELLGRLQQMEQILKDYGRLLTAHDDGHWLETRDETKTNDEPF